MEPRENYPTREHQYLIDAETLHRVLHDVRTPLTVMYARTQVLRRNIDQGRIQEACDCLSGLVAIEEATRRMEAMLHELVECDQGEWRTPVVSRKA